MFKMQEEKKGLVQYRRRKKGIECRNIKYECVVRREKILFFKRARSEYSVGPIHRDHCDIFLVV